jgi:hypothetical protein
MLNTKMLDNRYHYMHCIYFMTLDAFSCGVVKGVVLSQRRPVTSQKCNSNETDNRVREYQEIEGFL